LKFNGIDKHYYFKNPYRVIWYIDERPIMGLDEYGDVILGEPEVPLEHKEWEIVCIAREMFGEKIPEKPWMRHQEVEPKIKLHLCQPILKKDPEDGKEVPHCICGKEIPGEVMIRFYWVKGIYEGKRCGAKALPEGVKVKL
jgi:hypothetical protein